MYNNYYGGRQAPQYYYSYHPQASSSSSPSDDLASVPVTPTFLDPRRSELNYRRDDHYFQDDNIYRRYYSDYSRHGPIPLDSQVVGVRSSVSGPADVAPWTWSNYYDYPNYSGPVGTYHLPPRLPWHYETRDDTNHNSTRVEMYVPLCCDECERKVRKHLKDIEGVESVSADQWEKKVVVVGRGLHPHYLLRRMRQDKPASVFWLDRPQ